MWLGAVAISKHFSFKILRDRIKTCGTVFFKNRYKKLAL